MGIHVKPLTRNLSHLAVAKNTFRSTCIRVWWKPFSPFQVQYEQRITSYALSFVWIEPPMHINPFPKSKPIRTWNRVQKNIFRISSQSQVQENPGNGASNSNMGGDKWAKYFDTSLHQSKTILICSSLQLPRLCFEPSKGFWGWQGAFQGPATWPSVLPVEL